MEGKGELRERKRVMWDKGNDRGRTAQVFSPLDRIRTYRPIGV